MNTPALRILPLALLIAGFIQAPSASATAYHFRQAALGVQGARSEVIPEVPAEPPAPLCTPGNLLFTAAGTFVPATTAPNCTNFRVLLVGGGAGGGAGYTGAGGSGRVVYKSYPNLTGSIAVVVGAAGAGAPSGSFAAGGSGGKSKFGVDEALGGYSSSLSKGGDGGSGGGSSGSNVVGATSAGAAGGEGGANGLALATSAQPGGTGQGAGTFSAIYSNFTQTTFSNGAGGAGGVPNQSRAGGGGGGGVVVPGYETVWAGQPSGPYGEGGRGVGFGAGGGAGGARNSGYIAGGKYGAPGVVYVEWD